MPHFPPDFADSAASEDADCREARPVDPGAARRARRQLQGGEGPGLESDQARLVALRDRQAVIDTMVRYATGVDRRDWTLYRSCFCDEIEMDFTSWSGGESQKLSADAWVRGVRAGLEAFDATQHLSANHRVAVQGDRATCVSAMQARHYLAGETDGGLYTLGGSYSNELVRTGQGWRIGRCRLTVAWSQGSRELFAVAARRSRG